jgi:hypothetical protein
VPNILQLSDRIHRLQDRKNELTTLYLNSTLSYEELTNYLDTLIKSVHGNDSYTLNKSRDSETIGDDFTLQKFTIKINESDLSSVIKLLHALETGTPKMFVQRTDINRNRSKKSLSLTLEIASVQSAGSETQ